MADTRLEVSIGNIKFVGEGSEAWLSSEFAKLLEFSRTRPTLEAPLVDQDEEQKPPPDTGNLGTLPKFLSDKSATTNQVRKFLATAAWLQTKNSSNELATSEITKVLRDTHQTKINNPAKELSRNIAKGFCEKTSGGFFVTDDGLKSLK